MWMGARRYIIYPGVVGIIKNIRGKIIIVIRP
jgi:hypothetical protein